MTVVPCRYEPVRRTDGVDSFVRLLREYNRQRVKTRDERLREAVVDVDPDEAYCIPLTAGRGYGSLPPRYKMAQRFRSSGKDKLVLLILSDFDPDGEVIAESFARSMRDDFGIEGVHAIKVGLNLDHVTRFNLPRDIVKPKTSSPQYRKFVAKYGDRDVFEVEALRPAQIQQIVREAIDGVLDLAAFNAELDAEKRDAAFLAGVRATVHDALSGVDFGHQDTGGGE